MSITDRIEDLSDTQAAMSQLLQAAQELPDDASLLLNMQSLQNRQQRIEDNFAVQAEAGWLDVLDYRLFRSEGENPVIKALAGALTTFQNAFSVVYDAITTKPKIRASLSAAVTAATSFGFGYSYQGSVGFVLTLPSERTLFDDSNLDQAMAMLFLMAKAQSSDQIYEYAKSLGPASVNAVYKWAQTLVDNGMSTDLGWQRGSEIRSHVLLRTYPVRYVIVLV